MRGLPRTFWYLWVGALIDRLGTFVYTFLALYLTRARHFSVAHAGFVIALWGAGNFAAGPVGGYLADHLGRRRTMLLAFTLSAASMMNLGLARSEWHIAMATLMLGFCGNLFRPAQQATVADVVPPHDRTRAYGYLYWAVNLGFAGAAMLGGFMAERNFMLLFIADAATTVAFGIVVFLRVPETHPERHVAVRKRPDLRVPMRDRSFMIFVFAQLLVMLVGSQGNSTLPIDLRDHGIAPSTYGWLLAINGVMIVLLQPTAVSLVQRFDRGRVLALGALLQGIGFGLTAAGHSVGWYAFTIVVWTMAELCYSPVAPAVVSDLAPTHLRGTYQGVYSMAWGAGSFFAPLLGSAVLGRFGSSALWSSCFAVCLIAVTLHLPRGAEYTARVSTQTRAE
ncbi:MAG TPA: MFS transporter [Polyangia bacterium]|nr:MFS transporter [Polyangia bacterium]